MTHRALLALVTGLALGFPAAPLEARIIAKACRDTGRPVATQGLCACLQRAADAELSRSDQRLAARFFRDPQRAQDIRQSDRARHEAFWERYTRFGDLAERLCR